MNFKQDRAKKKVHGEFVFQIDMVDSTGQPIASSTSSSGSSSASPSPIKKSKPGPAPKPFQERGTSSQRKEVAAFVKNHDQELVFRAASKYKFTKDAPYVMRLIKRKPEVASKIKKWYQLERKKKGTYYYI